MDSIIGLLFNNVEVLIFLFVAVLPFLGKMLKQANSGSKPAQPPTVKPVRPMPSFGGGPGERKAAKPSPLAREANRREAERRELEEEAKRQQEQWDAARRQTAEEDQLRQEQRRRESEEQQRSRLTGQNGPAAQRQSTGSGSGLPRQGSPAAAAVQDNRAEHRLEKPTGDDLARAVVWAEILGPPRSKRPYGRR